MPADPPLKLTEADLPLKARRETNPLLNRNGHTSKGSAMTNNFEDRIRELTRPINGQMPRPWMTRMTNPRKAEVFVIGMNQSRKYPEDQICHQRHMDALFNRNGQSCRGIYDEVTEGKASHTRRNTDRLVDLLKEEGINNILETDVICYSTRKMSDLREAAHAGGEKRGKYIFRYLLEQICPPVLIVHGVGAGKELAATLGIGQLRVPQSASDVCDFQTELHLVIPIPSLSPQVFNGWVPWSRDLMGQVAARVRDRLARPE